MKRNKKTRQAETTIDSGNIQQRTVVKNFNVSNTILCWRVRKYSELRSYVIYYQIYKGNDFSCVFRLIKTAKTLYVAVKCEIHNRPSLFHLVNGDLMSPICISQEIATGLYIGQFPQATVCSPVGDVAKTGSLVLVFTIVPYDETIYIQDYEHSMLGEMWDYDVLCCDIGRMYLTGADSDFIINSGGASFKVHKAILFARSEFFRELFATHLVDDEFTVDANAGIMHLVLLYCYSGGLPSMTEDSLMTTLGVAKDLKISSLVERCQEDLDSYRKDRIESIEESTTKVEVSQDSSSS